MYVCIEPMTQYVYTPLHANVARGQPYGDPQLPHEQTTDGRGNGTRLSRVGKHSIYHSNDVVLRRHYPGIMYVCGMCCDARLIK